MIKLPINKAIIPFLLLTSFTLFSCGVDSSEKNSDNSSAEETTEPTIEYEWDKFDIPVNAPSGSNWVLHKASDEFDYNFTAGNPSDNFLEKWNNYYHSNWSGPAPTMWQKDHFYVENGELKLFVTRPSDVKSVSVSFGDKVKSLPYTYTACITNKNRIKYPAYVEAYAKIANNTMASDVWMLSPDDTQEIDVIEAYGSNRDNGGYGSDRIHLSHHMFIREPFTDYQPMDSGSWYRSPGGTIWRDDFHRVGVYWKSPTHLEYYIDGDLVRVVSGMEKIDPNRHNSKGTGIDKEMDLIINMEDQSWRAIQEPSLSPTNDELNNRDNQTFRVAWVRAYTAE